MAKSKFHASKDSQRINDVMGTLSQTLPDERPITAISVVENTSSCPPGFYPILKTYDEDSDADLWRHQAIFAKRTCRYLCLSKSEELSSSKMIGLRITSAGDPPPTGYSVVSLTSDTKRPAWRRRQLCCMLTNDATLFEKNQPLLTDIIVCSRFKKAPEGFQYAGEINGVLICFKTSTVYNRSQNINHMSPSPILSKFLNSENEGDTNYENVLYKNNTPEVRKRMPPERPPKATALVAELNNLNLHRNNNTSLGNCSANMPSPLSSHDYEILDKSYNLYPTRPAPPAPMVQPAPIVPPRVIRRTTSIYNSHTLGGWNGLEGIKFSLNPKLGGFSNINTLQIPVVKKKTIQELNAQYSYNFHVEHQT